MSNSQYDTWKDNKTGDISVKEITYLETDVSDNVFECTPSKQPDEYYMGTTNSNAVLKSPHPKQYDHRIRNRGCSII